MASLLKRISLQNSNALFRASISTVKPERLEYFGEMSKVWWNPNGRFRASHIYLPFRVEFMTKHLIARKIIITPTADNKDKLFSGIKVLDMGCGVGLFTERLASLGATVTGVDPSPLVIDTARNHLATCSPDLAPNITYIESTAEEYSMTKSGHYDVVVAFLILEHIQHKHIQHFLKNCLKLLKANGSLFLQCCNKNWLFAWWMLCWHTYVTHLSPKNITTYEQTLSKDDVIAHLNHLGCKLVDVEGIKFTIDGKKGNWTKSNAHFNLFHAVKHGEISH